MSMRQRCLNAFSFVAAISILNISAPAIAANSIKLQIGSSEPHWIDITELADFAETGHLSDDLKDFRDFVYLGFALDPETYSYYHDRGLGFENFWDDIQHQLNRPMSIDPNSQLQDRSAFWLKLMLPDVSSEEQTTVANLLAEKAQNTILIDFFQSLPGDTITVDNFISNLQTYHPEKPKQLETKPIDLRNWRQEGNPTSGNWVVASDGNSVLQTINGYPTFFVSPEEFINTTITGTLRVEETVDNDWIGFVFGYQSPIADKTEPVNGWKFMVFDWTKSGSMGKERPYEGATLRDIDGSFYPLTDFRVATNYGAGKGWTALTDHNFSLLYQTDRVKIDIDGETIFDISGDFESGRFGFYNASQSYVRYSGFESQPAPVPEPGTIGGLAVLGLVGLGKLATGKRKRAYR